MNFILITSLTLILIIIWHFITWKPISPIFFSNNFIKLGHRGMPVSAPENTIAGFKKVLNHQIDGIELDVQFSKDKELIIYHDWDLSNLGFPNQRIDMLDSKEIKKYFIKDDKNNNHTIPFLDEVLQFFPKNKILNIEIKQSSIWNTGIEKKILDRLNNYNLNDNVIISSFNPIVINRVKRINPNIFTAFLWSLETPILPFNNLIWILLAKPDGFNPDIKYINKNILKWVKLKKMKIISFTINNPSDLQKAINLDIDGIITDDPNIN